MTHIRFYHDIAPYNFVRCLRPLPHDWHNDQFALLGAVLVAVEITDRNPSAAFYLNASTYDGFLPDGSDLHGGELVCTDLITPYTPPRRSACRAIDRGELPAEIDPRKWISQRHSGIRGAQLVEKRYYARHT